MKRADNDMIDLIIAHHGGDCSDAQKRRLDRWVGASADNERAFRQCVALLNDLELTGNYLRSHGDVRALMAGRKNMGRKRTPWRVAGIAAAAAAAIGAAILLFPDGDNGGGDAKIAENVTLTLSGAEDMAIDDSRLGVIFADGDATVENRDGVLVFGAQTDGATADGEPRWATLRVPARESIDFVLEDGTHVWLNSNSNLRFPVKFASGERRVHVEGEAYFAVAGQNGKPFVVETGRQSIKVLGTEFNVCARAGEAEHTTLVEGSVEVAAAGGDAVTLVPGQQALLADGARSYVVREIDTDSATAWRRGVFVFDGKTLGEVFGTLAHWYGIEYEFADEAAAGLVFRGNLRRQTDVGVILDAIEMSGQVNIEMKGTRVRVKTGH